MYFIQRSHWLNEQTLFFIDAIRTKIAHEYQAVRKIQVVIILFKILPYEACLAAWPDLYGHGTKLWM